MGIDSQHLLKHVIRPVLTDLDLWSPAAERLVLGTACQESHCGEWLVQLGNGPAKGIYQCEPATHQDIWTHYLNWKEDLAVKVSKWRVNTEVDASELVWNLAYATAICRIHYYRVHEALPDDLPGQAAYWKKYYNTHLGRGTEEEYRANWQRYVPQGVV